MPVFYRKSPFSLFITVFLLALGFQAHAQSGGSSTSVTGTVVDPTGAVVANATVEFRNPVSRFERTTTTDSAGKSSSRIFLLILNHLTVGGRVLLLTRRTSMFDPLSPSISALPCRLKVHRSR